MLLTFPQIFGLILTVYLFEGKFLLFPTMSSINFNSDVPVGVLHDLYLGKSKFKSPWKISIHFQAYPKSVLIYKHVEVEKVFFHSMKQALFMLYSNARVFNDLSIENQQLIWKGVVEARGSLQESLFNTVLKLPKDQVKLIPVRLIYLAAASPSPSSAVAIANSTNNGNSSEDVESHHGPVYSTEQVLAFSQRPVKPLAATGAGASYLRDRTLREVLIEDFRQYALQQAPVSVVGVQPPVAATSGDVSGNTVYLIQGMELSLDMPIYELWCIMAHADMFLYISIAR